MTRILLDKINRLEGKIELLEKIRKTQAEMIGTEHSRQNLVSRAEKLEGKLKIAVDAMTKAAKHLMDDCAIELNVSYAMEHLDDALDGIQDEKCDVCGGEGVVGKGTILETNCSTCGIQDEKQACSTCDGFGYLGTDMTEDDPLRPCPDCEHTPPEDEKQEDRAYCPIDRAYCSICGEDISNIDFRYSSHKCRNELISPEPVDWEAIERNARRPDRGDLFVQQCSALLYLKDEKQDCPTCGGEGVLGIDMTADDPLRPCPDCGDPTLPEPVDWEYIEHPTYWLMPQGVGEAEIISKTWVEEAIKAILANRNTIEFGIDSVREEIADLSKRITDNVVRIESLDNERSDEIANLRKRVDANKREIDESARARIRLYDRIETQRHRVSDHLAWHDENNIAIADLKKAMDLHAENCHGDWNAARLDHLGKVVGVDHASVVRRAAKEEGYDVPEETGSLVDQVADLRKCNVEGQGVGFAASINDLIDKVDEQKRSVDNLGVAFTTVCDGKGAHHFRREYEELKQKVNDIEGLQTAVEKELDEHTPEEISKRVDELEKRVLVTEDLLDHPHRSTPPDDPTSRVEIIERFLEETTAPGPSNAVKWDRRIEPDDLGPVDLSKEEPDKLKPECTCDWSAAVLTEGDRMQPRAFEPDCPVHGVPECTCTRNEGNTVYRRDDNCPIHGKKDEKCYTDQEGQNWGSVPPTLQTPKEGELVWADVREDSLNVRLYEKGEVGEQHYGEVRPDEIVQLKLAMDALDKIGCTLCSPGERVNIAQATLEAIGTTVRVTRKEQADE